MGDNVTPGISVELATAEDMVRAGELIGAQLAAGDVLVLTGPLGAGKTTFARGLGRALGVRGPVTSPTFVLARTHPSLVGGPELIHVDAYRLGDPAELDDLGLDLAASVTVVEWGSEAVPLITDRWLEVTIERSTALSAPAGGTERDDHDQNSDHDHDHEHDDEPVDPRRLTLTTTGVFNRPLEASLGRALRAEFGASPA
ncbi:tRNA (adenosine(37)-N6)-threonylcarbamoyltransferase complex ATPase subunit type 1 TsaE [Pseudoclavibacter sp. AY1F1]|uniref:tRNA (adenosine(37)-N6)-threonylcarbamoyltransferase complex ATPase subunit type 1 TsaE n=1 Tax=Pseudoclavibacter sp. AY1F1 TaxID=2080583 RepID=UPI000CE83CCF|nr:tRNA (adenosine(37)-N6)-threonylcarbamoyltransferase complex ATPase subunit type 1 TsaE [Pseudoclavibacter sp. AY1F1]PPF43839.1 tRNA (adenosine(37)-N6)-threonylcarbamoyltransferase complex ATPase subunit type 1 TsaE [Pseudoclavibacter sp. AY1F1]